MKIKKTMYKNQKLRLAKKMLLGGALFFLPFFGGCATLPSDTPDASVLPSQPIPSPTPVFHEFAMDIFLEEVTADTISLHYTLAKPEDYGITEYPLTLGSVKDAVEFDEDALTLYEQLFTYSPEELTKEELRTYHALKQYLELMLKNNFSPYLSELLGPTTGYQAQLPIILAEYRFDDTEDVERYLELLPCIYDYFEEIAEFERAKSAAGYFMSDETAKEIIAQCEEFVLNPDDNFLLDTFEERLSELSLSASEETEYILANQSALYSYVLPAYDLLIQTLTECLGTCKNELGLCHFTDGKEYYELLLKLRTGTDKTMDEVKAILSDAITAGCNTMALALAKEPSLYDSALAPDYPESNPATVLSFMKEQTAEDFPYIDCGNCEIKYIPEALQSFVSPAMYLIPPMDNFEQGIIYINGSPLYSEEALFPTVVHEGYPGHLYQTVACLSTSLHPLRYLLAPVGYEEGWATYVETYCYRYAGFSETLTEFLQADQIATLCLYALSDIFIHYDGYTPEELSTFLMDYGFPEESAHLIYQVLLSEPGAYLPYAVGCLEFLELKAQAETLWGTDYSDYKFHEFLLEAGPMRFGELRKELGNYQK